MRVAASNEGLMMKASNSSYECGTRSKGLRHKKYLQMLQGVNNLFSLNLQLNQDTIKALLLPLSQQLRALQGGSMRASLSSLEKEEFQIEMQSSQDTTSSLEPSIHIAHGEEMEAMITKQLVSAAQDGQASEVNRLVIHASCCGCAV